MRGLLIKDLCIMAQRKRFFLLMLVIGIAMSVSTGAEFFVGWFVLLSSIFSISTITYDEFDNCYPFLMTLPVDGKSYAVEKYVFGFLCGFAAWIISAVIAFSTQYFRHESINFFTDIVDLFIYVPLFMILLDISIPVNLKWGSEKGRMALMILGGGAFVAGFLLKDYLGPVVENIENAESSSAPVLIFTAAAVIITAFSIAVSLNIMKKKEY